MLPLLHHSALKGPLVRPARTPPPLLRLADTDYSSHCSPKLLNRTNAAYAKAREAGQLLLPTGKVNQVARFAAALPWMVRKAASEENLQKAWVANGLRDKPAGRRPSLTAIMNTLVRGAPAPPS